VLKENSAFSYALSYPSWLWVNRITLYPVWFHGRHKRGVLLCRDNMPFFFII